MADTVSKSDKSRDMVFLGICNQAHPTFAGPDRIHAWNLIGLTTIVLSYIFPLSLQGVYVGFAVSAERPMSEAKVKIVDENDIEVGSMTLSVKKKPPLGDVSPSRDDGPLILRPEYGWTISFLHLDRTEWIIPRPGNYYLDLIAGGEAERIGSLRFEVADPLPLTSERIAAIKTHPSAAKSVRFNFKCKECSSKIEAYSALERSRELEEKGYIWYRDMPCDFECTCGKAKADLRYVQRNLHGLLGHPVNASGHVSFMPLYERSSLTSVRVEFANLLSEDPPEESIQKFLEEHPVLLHQFPAIRLIPKPPILTNYVADFAIVSPQKELVLIEIEKASTRLLNKDGGVAAPLTHAFNQVSDWLMKVGDHRIAALDSLEIDKKDVGVIRGVVIAGRDSGYDAFHLRKLKARDFGQVEFLTYDDLLFSMDALVQNLARN